MELCFVAGTVGDFVAGEAAARPERFGAATAQPSELLDQEGRGVGSGAPYYCYTVGQRRGLGVAAAERLYVLGVDAAANRVTVGTRAELAASGLEGRDCRWLGPPPSGPFDARVKIRARHAGVEARVRPLAGGRVAVDFAEPQAGVAPGQAAVFYQGTRVVGGCWIERGTLAGGERRSQTSGRAEASILPTRAVAAVESPESQAEGKDGPGIFSDGFESGDTGAWSVTVP
jgi:tRNA U34 2-thiouridine synthase MnmA/TrmU